MSAWQRACPSIRVAATAAVSIAALRAVGPAAPTERGEGAGRLTNAGPTVSASCGAVAPGSCLYVDAVAGNDANPGTNESPFRTVQRAASVGRPGDVVMVRNGVYTGSSKAVLSITRGGTAARYVTFKADHRWGAVLDGQNNWSADGIRITASFVRVEGFEIKGVWHDAISPSSDISNFQIVGNHIHDIGRRCETRSIGLSAIGVGNDSVLIEGNLIHDIGRYGPGENGCSQPNSYWQNHDHGVYLESGNDVVIRNNVFYNMVRGWSVHRYNSRGGSVNRLLVVNNTFCCGNPAKAGEIIIANDLSNALIANNIFYRSMTAGIAFYGGTMRDDTVANNLASDGPVNDRSPSGVTFMNNLERRDPLFMDPARFDFHLRAGSPAIDAGLHLPTVPRDFEGNMRPRGAGWDIGAFESF